MGEVTVRARRKTKSFLTFWRLVSERSTSGGMLEKRFEELRGGRGTESSDRSFVKFAFDANC